MPERELLAQYYLSFGGNDAPTDLVSTIKEVDVEQSLHLPDMFRILIHDPELRWIDSDLIYIGQEVEIAAKSLEKERAWLITGEVTAIEPSFPEEGVPVIEVRGYDKLHRLHRGAKSRTFIEMTDSDIVSRIANEYGLRADVAATSVVYPHVYQDNASDFEFLRERAAPIGYVVAAEKNTLTFKPFRQAGTTTVELRYGSTLLEFRPRVTAAAQAEGVTVRGWDYKGKEALHSELNSDQWPNAQSVREHDGQRAFGGGNRVVTANGHVQTAGLADDVARGLRAIVEEAKVRAEGLALGDPRIRAGSTVSIDAVGTRFRGDYFVTGVRHVFHATERYNTEFSVTGLHTETVRDLVVGTREPAFRERRAAAPVLAIGIVSNNDDPDGLGRVKVKFPWLSDSDESAWARVASVMAGADRGLYTLPEIDDEVLVAFVHGSIDDPVILGGLWNGVDKPPNAATAVSGGQVQERVWKTRAGHIILFDDTGGSEKIEIKDSSGKNSIVFDTASSTITITAAMAVKVESQGELSVKAATSMKLEAAAMELSAQGQLKISGATVEIN